MSRFLNMRLDVGSNMVCCITWGSPSFFPHCQYGGVAPLDFLLYCWDGTLKAYTHCFACFLWHGSTYIFPLCLEKCINICLRKPSIHPGTWGEIKLFDLFKWGPPISSTYAIKLEMKFVSKTRVYMCTYHCFTCSGTFSSSIYCLSFSHVQISSYCLSFSHVHMPSDLFDKQFFSS